jgi:hypothetical protein
VLPEFTDASVLLPRNNAINIPKQSQQAVGIVSFPVLSEQQKSNSCSSTEFSATISSNLVITHDSEATPNMPPAHTRMEASFSLRDIRIQMSNAADSFSSSHPTHPSALTMHMHSLGII